MEVGNSVPGVPAHVEHQPVTGAQALLAGDGLGGQQEINDVSAVLLDDGVGVGEVPARHDQHVGGRLGVQVAERVAPRRREDFGRGDLARHDPAEQAVVAHAGTVARQ